MSDKILSSLDTSSWEGYKHSLAKAINAAEDAGFSQRSITRLASELGDYLTDHATADLPENQVLREMWQVAEEKEKYTLSSLLMRVVEHSNSSDHQQHHLS